MSMGDEFKPRWPAVSYASDRGTVDLHSDLATERERDRYKAALELIAAGDVPGVGDHLECVQAFARGVIAGVASGLRAGEYTATHTGPLTAEQLAEDVEPGLAEPTAESEAARLQGLAVKADEVARFEALKARADEPPDLMAALKASLDASISRRAGAGEE